MTTTGYKFLEIGINVGPPSYVEIAVGDYRGNELILSIERALRTALSNRWNIRIYLWNRYKDISKSISVGPLTVRFCMINDATLVRLESLNVCLTMTESVILNV